MNANGRHWSIRNNVRKLRCWIFFYSFLPFCWWVSCEVDTERGGKGANFGSWLPPPPPPPPPAAPPAPAAAATSCMDPPATKLESVFYIAQESWAKICWMVHQLTLPFSRIHFWMWPFFAQNIVRYFIQTLSSIFVSLVTLVTIAGSAYCRNGKTGTLWQLEGAPLLSLQLCLATPLHLHLASETMTQHSPPLTSSPPLTLFPSLQRLGWASSHVVSFPVFSHPGCYCHNEPNKGVRAQWWRRARGIIGRAEQPARHQRPIIAIKSIRALSLAGSGLWAERAGPARPMRDERRTAAALKLSCDDFASAAEEDSGSLNAHPRLALIHL